ncbi:MAG: hypothetical protein ACLS4S_01370 [Bacteroides nordii]
MEELLKEIAKELAAQNKLIALLIAKHNVDTFNKSGMEIIEEMKNVSTTITDWSYKYPEANFPLNEPEKTKITFLGHINDNLSD